MRSKVFDYQTDLLNLMILNQLADLLAEIDAIRFRAVLRRKERREDEFIGNWVHFGYAQGWRLVSELED